MFVLLLLCIERRRQINPLVKSDEPNSSWELLGRRSKSNVDTDAWAFEGGEEYLRVGSSVG